MISKEIRILIVGAGRIGNALHELLNEEGYSVVMVDRLDAVIMGKVKPTDVFAAVPYFAIPSVAEAAAEVGANFYDFTENVEVKLKVQNIYSRFGVDKTAAVVTGCGVAPGLCNIIASKLMKELDFTNKVAILCGGVPVDREVNPLHYYNIWSLDGLWGLYFGEPIRYKKDGEVITGKLGVGSAHIDTMGKKYEAFYTGGNTVDELFTSTIPNVFYGTIRHRGHLMEILNLHRLLDFEKNPEMFKSIISSLPKDEEDETLIIVQVEGIDFDGNETVLRDERIIKPYKGPTMRCSAMQHATARGGVIAMENVHQKKLTGFVKQEDLELIC